MVDFWISQTIITANSTHCRHIHQLLHDPVLHSTVFLPKNKLYKYQESDKYYDIQV